MIAELENKIALPSSPTITEAPKKAIPTKLRERAGVSFTRQMIVNDIDKQQELLGTAFSKIEDILTGAGFNLDKTEFIEFSPFDPYRIQSRDKLIAEYNANRTNLKRQLPTSIEVYNELQERLYKEVNQREAQLTKPTGITEKALSGLTEFAASIAADAVSAMSRHPARSLSMFAVPAIASIAAASFVSGIGMPVGAALATWLASAGTFATTYAALGMVAGNKDEENLRRRMAQRPELTSGEYFQEKFVEGIAAEVGVKALGVITKSAYKLTVKPLAKIISAAGKEGTEATKTAAKKILAKMDPTNKIIQEVAEDLSEKIGPVSPAVRAAIYESIKKHSPSSLIDPEARTAIQSTLIEIGEAYARNDQKAIAELLATEPMETLFGKERILDVADSILETMSFAGDKASYKEAFKQEIRTAQLLSKYSNEQLRRELEARGLYTGEPASGNIVDLINERYTLLDTAIAAGRSPLYAEAKESLMGTVRSTLERQFSAIKANNPTALDKASESALKLANSQPEITAKELMSGISPETIRKLNRVAQGDAYRHNLELSRLAIEDQIASALASADTLAPNVLNKSGREGSGNVLRNILNAILHNAQDSSNAELQKTATAMLNETQAYLKNPTASLNSLDLEQMVNALMNNTNDGGIYSAQKKLYNDYAKAIDEKIMLKGHESMVNEGHVPAFWNPEKLSAPNGSMTYTQERELFVARGLQNFNTTKMMADAQRRNRPIEDMSEFLREMYDNIYANRGPRQTLDALGNQVSTYDKVVSFKDAAGWIEMHKYYGHDLDTETLMERMLGRMRRVDDITSIGLLPGQTGSAMSERIVTLLENEYHRRGVPLPKSTGFNDLAKTIRTLFNDYTEASFNGKRGWGEKIAWGLLTQARTSALSGASSTAFLTDSIGSFGLLKRSIGVKKGVSPSGFMEGLKIATQSASKEDLLEALNISKTLNAEASKITNAGIFNGLLTAGRKINNAPRRALNWAAEFGDTRGKLLFTRHLHKNKSKTFSELNKQLRVYLKNHGITDADWEIYRTLRSYTNQEGIEILTSKYASSTLAASADQTISRVATKFAAAETSAGLLASPRTTLVGRAMTSKAGASTNSRIAHYLADPFFSISESIYLSQMPEFISLLLSRDYPEAIMQMFTSALGGTINAYLRDVLNGKNPDLTDIGELTTLLARGAAYGLFTGPTIERLMFAHAAYKTMPDLRNLVVHTLTEGKPTYKDMRNTALLFNPYRNFYGMGALAQHYTLDYIFEMIDPEGAAKYYRTLEKQRYTGEKSELYYKLMSRNAFNR